MVVIFTLLEPDISDPLRGASLLLFWAVHVASALVLLQGMQMLLAHARFVMNWSPWAQVAFSGLIGALLFAPIAAVFDWLFGVEVPDEDRSETLIQSLAGELTGSIGLVLLVWVALNVTRLLHIQAAGPHAEIEDETTPAFWSRVPKEIGRDLVAVSAELHYMRVYTGAGQALILYPFGQAVEELGETVRGVQIHRSHWVALGQVAELTRRGQGALCITTTGVALPVSRSRRKALEAAMSPKSGAATSMV